MKIHFCAAISQSHLYQDVYERAVKALLSQGHQVQHAQITEGSLEKIKEQTDEEFMTYYKQMLKWIARCELMVAEASFPSTMNVGHEISLALEKGKVVIVLFEKGRIPTLFHGLNSDKILMVEYTRENLEDVLLEAVEFAKESTDARFNFFISPRHIAYLDWIARTRKIPRSVYLRELIETDKDKNAEYEM